jgi:hypothetical protein
MVHSDALAWWKVVDLDISFKAPLDSREFVVNRQDKNPASEVTG